MKQQIIFAPQLSGTDYLKSLAMFNKENINTFGVRVMNGLELARYMLQASGYVIEQDFVTNNNLAAILYLKTKNISYFSNYTYKDVYDLLISVNDLRKCIPYNERDEIHNKLPTDLFVKKNEAVKQFYDLLVATLKENKLIDEIGIIRLAIEKGMALDNFEFVRYEEFILTNLEEALLNKADGKVVEPIKFDNGDKLNISTYLKAFGQNNEIEWILKYIYDHNIKFDECLIAATDVTQYAKILSNYQATIGFPLIIGNNESIFDTASGRLYSLLLEWEDNHFHLDYLQKVLGSRDFDIEKFKKVLEMPENFDDFVANSQLSYFERLSFDKIIEAVGDLEIGFSNPDNNRDRFNDYASLIETKYKEDSNNPYNQRDYVIVTFVYRIKEIFEQGISFLLEQFTVIDENNEAVEMNALKNIILVLSYHDRFGVPNEEILRFLKSVAIGNRKPKPGHLYITSISSAISYLRKHLFIVGLDSKVFPGKVSEDPIIFDRDYECFGIKDASSRQMNENKNDYHALIKFAKTLGVDIHLSYAYYNSQTTKEQSASSVVFETYKEEKNDDKVTIVTLNDEYNTNKDKFIKTEFFDNDLFPISKVGQVLKYNTKLVPNQIKSEETKEVSANDLIGYKGLSASAISKFIECEYEFYLNVLLHINQEKDTNIYEIIPDNDLGTLIHSVMEEFTPKMDKSDFVNIAIDKFNEYMICHPTDNKHGEAKALADFQDIISSAYDMEAKSGLPGVLKEEDLFAIHKKSGIKIHGLPDKVEQFSDGRFRVVDYKTGKSIKHFANKPESMLQGAHYAYIIENGKNPLNDYGKKKISVDEFVFRYPRKGMEVSSCEMKDDGSRHTIQEYIDYLDEKLMAIAKALETGHFDKTGNCKNCYFKSICGGKKKDEEN